MKYDSFTGKGVVNTIVLNPANGFYEEYVLANDVEVTQASPVLPGAIVAVRPATVQVEVPTYEQDTSVTPSVDKIYKYGDNEIEYKKIVGKTYKTRTAVQADGVATVVVAYPDPDATSSNEWAYNFNIDNFEPYIVIENALLGKTINHLAFPGEVTPVYRPVSGDRFLLRAKPGQYTEGDPLYFIKTDRGIYVTKTYDTITTDQTAKKTSTVIKAYAAETYFIGETPANANYDAIDNSTMERPSTVKPWKDVEDGNMNLLRVRMA